MLYRFFLLVCFALLAGRAGAQENNPALAALFRDYMEENYRLNPVTATFVGDPRYNDQLPATFTDSYNEQLKNLYNRFLARLRQVPRNRLNENDRISYDIFRRDLELALEGLTLKTNRIPLNQFTGLHQTLALFGSGAGAQPFRTVKDYEDWLKRAGQFPAWCDSAIVYFRKGMTENYVLPHALIVKLVPQLKALQAADPAASVFYGPVKNFPAGFSAADRQRLTEAFQRLITQTINPAYGKLEGFISNEYLPRGRTTAGLSGVPNGGRLYDFAIRSYTTTSKKPEEIYNTGLAEVQRIRGEMEKIRQQVGFGGTLDSFFFYTKNDPQFLPYKTAEEVLTAYRGILRKIEPHLAGLFTRQPKTPFEVRQTEAFRAASAAAQYFSGLPDGSRPGIFYVPIVDATKYTTAKENLFIHEAIPGHHFQIMIQKENKDLPAFRQNGGNSAFAEGWGLYAESLGPLLGCYTDPYQRFYALGDEIHRAIRLVVDVGMHARGWTREQAIAYMRANEPITEQSAVAEIERYMALPGQALSYKIGELKIRELRSKYERQLGGRFSLAAFHDELLKDGNMPLSVLERKMDAWAARQKK